MEEMSMNNPWFHFVVAAAAVGVTITLYVHNPTDAATPFGVFFGGTLFGTTCMWIALILGSRRGARR